MGLGLLNYKIEKKSEENQAEEKRKTVIRKRDRSYYEKKGNQKFKMIIGGGSINFNSNYQLFVPKEE